MDTIIEEIKAERTRQIMQGYSISHDDAHKRAELARAAAAYALCHTDNAIAKMVWPFTSSIGSGDRRALLVKSAALLVAEVERIDRAEIYSRSKERAGALPENKTAEPSPTPSYYRWTYQGVTFDFYRLMEILGIKDHAQAHGIKKFIRAGRGSGDKDMVKDINEGMDCIRRWKEMIIENMNQGQP